MSESYSQDEQLALLRIVRTSLEAATTNAPQPEVVLELLPEALRAERACFVTLYSKGRMLRGCIGILAARQPLAQEVQQIALQTAFADPRFPPLQAYELASTTIEISILTPPAELRFEDPLTVPELLRPGVDGVILVIGGRRATFLPHVWEKIPDPEEFLDHLCRKMGMLPRSWVRPDTQLFTYQAILIEEQSDSPDG